MAHDVHGMVGFMAVKGPIAGVVGNDVECTNRANGHIDRRLRPLRTLRHPAAIGADHREMVAVQMDRVIGNGSGSSNFGSTVKVTFLAVGL